MPTNEELYAEAEKLLAAGSLQDGIAKLEEVVKQDDSFVLAHYSLSVQLGKVGRHEEAVQHARRGCELAPNDPFSFTSMSVVCQRAGKIQEAEDAMARSRMMH